jgi:hypothetical protein
MSKEENQTIGGSKNQLTCRFCGLPFCSVHDNAHAGHACNEYKSAQQVRKLEKAIRQFTKPCSHYGIPIEKESGCGHIVCSVCKDDMHFHCSTHLYLIGDMVRSCKNCVHNCIAPRAYRLTVCLTLPFYITRFASYASL